MRNNNTTGPRLLYLHCNKLMDWSILQSLTRLRMLSRLTLHCNPMSGGKSYRPTLIANLPQLRTLDFSLISDEERDATTLAITAKFVR